MNRLVAIAMLMVVLAGLAYAGGRFERATSPESTAATGEIADLWDRYARCVMDLDFDHFVELHHPEAYEVPVEASTATNAGDSRAVRDQWTALSQVCAREMRIELEEVRVLGAYAYSVGTYAVKEVRFDEGAARTGFGEVLSILRKDSQGSWRFYRVSFDPAGSGRAIPPFTSTYRTPRGVGALTLGAGRETSSHCDHHNRDRNYGVAVRRAIACD